MPCPHYLHRDLGVQASVGCNRTEKRHTLRAVVNRRLPGCTGDNDITWLCMPVTQVPIKRVIWLLPMVLVSPSLSLALVWDHDVDQSQAHVQSCRYDRQEFYHTGICRGPAYHSSMLCKFPVSQLLVAVEET